MAAAIFYLQLIEIESQMKHTMTDERLSAYNYSYFQVRNWGTSVLLLLYLISLDLLSEMKNVSNMFIRACQREN